MATFTYVDYHANAGEAWAAVVERVSSYIVGNIPVGDIGQTVVINLDGFRCFQWQLNSPPDSAVFNNIVMDLPADGTLPLDVLLGLPGFSHVAGGNGGPDSGTDYSAGVDAALKQGKQNVVETLCPDASVVQSGVERIFNTLTYALADNYFSWTLFAARTYWMMSSDSVRLYSLVTAPGEQTDSMSLPQIGTSTAPVDPASLAALVKAVDAITDQDIEVSLNRGAYTFSIKSKVTTG